MSLVLARADETLSFLVPGCLDAWMYAPQRSSTPLCLSSLFPVNNLPQQQWPTPKSTEQAPPPR